MYLCYLDESGVIQRNPNTSSHFVLVGLAMPAKSWKVKDAAVESIKASANLDNAEVHAAWMTRRYPEQERIPNFAQLAANARRTAVAIERKKDLAKAALRGRKAIATLAKNYRKTEQYIHLTHAERTDLLRRLSDEIGTWTDVVLLGDAQEKAATPNEAKDERILHYAFEQVVSRFHHFLERAGIEVGIVVHDRNETTARQITEAMRFFHAGGTFWHKIPRLVETPFFVDSADLDDPAGRSRILCDSSILRKQ